MNYQRPIPAGNFPRLVPKGQVRETHRPERSQLHLRFTCPACRQLGFAVCERDLAPARAVRQPAIIGVSSGFSIRATKGADEIVCGCCETVIAL